MARGQFHYGRLIAQEPHDGAKALIRGPTRGFGLAPSIRPASSRGAMLDLARRCPNADQPDSSNRQQKIHTVAAL